MGEGRCVRNSDCEDGFGCDAESRACVPGDLPNRSCDDGRDCFAGERCLMNTCVQPPDAGGDWRRDAEVVDGPRLEQGVVELGVADVALADVALADVALADVAAINLAVPDVALADVAAINLALADVAATDLAVADVALADVAAIDLGPPPTPPRGLYLYDRIPLGGAEDLHCVDFHPDGSYAVIGQRTNVLHVLDWQTQTAARFDFRPAAANTHIYWDDIAFAPDGSHAYLVGTEISANARIGVVWRFDDPMYRQRDAAVMPVAREVLRHAQGDLTGIEYPRDGGPPVVLGRIGPQGSTAVLRELDPLTDTFSGLLASHFSGVGCDDLAFVNNEFGGPGIVIVCGGNGADTLYYTEVAGIGEWRQDPGNNNLGNTSRIAAHPSGDYALAVGWSGRHLWRFEGALFNNFAAAPWFQRDDIYGIRFQQDGQRALIFHGARGNPLAAVVIEYRHDLYDCPLPFDDCDLTDVSIPNFGAPPFSATDQTRLFDAAFRPGCDGGLLVGGASNFQGASAQLIRFQVEGARGCP